jgi:hypothetical protein
MAVLDGPLNGTETLTYQGGTRHRSIGLLIDIGSESFFLRFQDDAELSRAGSCRLIIADRHHGGPVRGRW